MLRAFLLVIPFVLSALVPLLPDEEKTASTDATFSGFPVWFDERPLVLLPLSEREHAFARGFPGHTARFSDGQREIIMRWVEHPTRKLHPAADCLRAAGYSIEPTAARVDADTRRWGCVIATRGAQRMRVCERIHDEAGESWPDVSSWYWPAFLGRSTGPWWAITTAEPESQMLSMR